MPPTFEIGMVYRKNSRLHLAVDHHTLITVQRGKFSEVRPYVKYEAIRNISVDELCQRWKVAVDQLDVATSRYLSPPAPPKSARQAIEARKAMAAQPILTLAKSIGSARKSGRDRLEANAGSRKARRAS